MAPKAHKTYRRRRHAVRALPLTEALILRWADAHYDRTGAWPQQVSGEVEEAPGTTWLGVDLALLRGNRGLPGGSSLARLLARRRQVRNRSAPFQLQLNDILEWAAAHHLRAGTWPTKHSGSIPEAPRESWWAVDQALRRGTRGLRGGSSLAEILLSHCSVRSNHTLPALTVEQILAWARAHFRRTGRWPTSLSGPIAGSHGDTWKGIDFALRKGRRGLARGSSVAKLLAEHGLKINRASRRALTYTRILRWADVHREETGAWPNSQSGKVRHVRGETWHGVDDALRHGLRGLPGGLSVVRLLASRRDMRNPAALPELTVQQILTWADAHHKRTGRWPRPRSGPLPEAPGETWRKVHTALLEGGRGLPGGSSLARLLDAHRGVPNVKRLPVLTPEQILAWADAHRARTGEWPSLRSGPILGADGETWRKADNALRKGYRGLPGGSSLFGMLQGCRDQ